MLMTLMLGAGGARAQSKTDIEYDRAIKKIAQMDRVKIDTVVVNEFGPVEMVMGGHSSRTDSITITYFLEKYDLSQTRYLGVLRAKKYVYGTIAHEMHHRANNKLRNKIIFRNIQEERSYRIYHEITARMSEIITLRKQLQESYQNNNGKFKFENLLGEPVKRIPSAYKTKFTPKKLYTQDLSSMHNTYGPYFTYITYVINHPDILKSDTISSEESDYMLISALNQVELRKSYYVPAFASRDIIPKSQKMLELYVVLKTLNLNKDEHVFTTDFADEFKKLGFYHETSNPTYGEVIDRIQNHSDLIPINLEPFDNVIPEMFIFNNTNLFEKFSPLAYKALQSHVSRYLKLANQYANEFYSETESHDKLLRTMYDIYKDRTSSKQKFHRATDKIAQTAAAQKSTAAAAPSLVTVPQNHDR